MSLLSMKLVEHVPGKLRVYKNGLGFSTSIYRWDNTKLVKRSPLLYEPNEYKKVPTGTSYIQVIKNWGNAFLNCFNHGIHAPKK